MSRSWLHCLHLVRLIKFLICENCLYLGKIIMQRPQLLLQACQVCQTWSCIVCWRAASKTICGHELILARCCLEGPLGGSPSCCPIGPCCGPTDLCHGREGSLKLRDSTLRRHHSHCTGHSIKPRLGR